MVNKPSQSTGFVDLLLFDEPRSNSETGKRAFMLLPPKSGTLFLCLKDCPICHVPSYLD